MPIDRRGLAQMLRDENESLKARIQQISIRLTRHQQAFRALNQMDDTMSGLSAEFDLKKLLSKLLSLALHACDSENGSLILVDDESGELVFADVLGEAREQLRNHRISSDTGIVGNVVITKIPVLVPDVEKSVQWSSEIDQVVGFKTRALMCAPLYNDDKTYGAIEVVNNNSNDLFDENDLAILRVTARYVSQALQKAEYMTLLGVNQT
ncbi:MAG: GAF domain-containing protein [Gammaproteobacteria bacterium]|nr:MAG: GAF domain-containing protein [Gammaproteobacteria bacterium]